MCDVTIESFEFTVHGGMDGRRELASVFKCMEYLVTLGEEGSQSAMTHLEPARALFLVMGGSESSCLQYCLLVRIVIHVVISDLKEMFIVHHSAVAFREDLGPVGGAFGHCFGFKLDGRERYCEAYSVVVACNTLK